MEGPSNKALAERPCVRPEWEALGWREMPSPEQGAGDSGGSRSSSDVEPEVHDSDDDSQFNMEVSDRARERAAQLRGCGSDHSTDVSDTRRGKRWRVIKRLGMSRASRHLADIHHDFCTRLKTHC